MWSRRASIGEILSWIRVARSTGKDFCRVVAVRPSLTLIKTTLVLYLHTAGFLSAGLDTVDVYDNGDECLFMVRYLELLLG